MTKTRQRPWCNDRCRRARHTPPVMPSFGCVWATAGNPSVVVPHPLRLNSRPVKHHRARQELRIDKPNDGPSTMQTRQQQHYTRDRHSSALCRNHYTQNNLYSRIRVRAVQEVLLGGRGRVGVVGWFYIRTMATTRRETRAYSSLIFLFPFHSVFSLFHFYLFYFNCSNPRAWFFSLLFTKVTARQLYMYTL